MKNFNFRLAQEKDIPELVYLVNSAYRGTSSKQGWTFEADILDGQRIDAAMLQAIIQQPQEAILLGYQDTTLFGCVHLQIFAHKAYIGMLTINPALQRNGLGKILLQAGEDWLKRACNAPYIEMTVIHTRVELIDWYKKRGYVVMEERRPFPYGDERFGIPKVQGLEFVVLQKPLMKHNTASVL